MKNKINGIDVSECEYINCCSKKAKCIILQDNILSDSQYCESEPNCYFKQFKRLQQENEELKKEKEKIEEDAEYFLNGDYCDEKCNSAKNELKYKQALEEIREMLKKSMSLKSNAYNHFINVEKAIDKINEVLNDRD